MTQRRTVHILNRSVHYSIEEIDSLSTHMLVFRPPVLNYLFFIKLLIFQCTTSPLVLVSLLRLSISLLSFFHIALFLLCN